MNKGPSRSVIGQPSETGPQPQGLECQLSRAVRRGVIWTRTMKRNISSEFILLSAVSVRANPAIASSCHSGVDDTISTADEHMHELGFLDKQLSACFQQPSGVDRRICGDQRGETRELTIGRVNDMTAA